MDGSIHHTPHYTPAPRQISGNQGLGPRLSQRHQFLETGLMIVVFQAFDTNLISETNRIFNTKSWSVPP